MIAKIIPFTRLPYFSISRQQKREISFFDYKIPEELVGKIKFGQIVEIYFRNKGIQGLVVGLKKTSLEKKIKEVRKIISEESIINKEQFKLIKWLSSFYVASSSTILKTSLPKVVRQAKKSVGVFHDRDIYRPKINGQSLKISKKFLPELKKMINIFSYSRRKKFLLFWQDPFEKIALYYFLIKKTLEKGQKVLILVPEIDEANFLLKYFSKLSPKILVLHSELKKSEIWNSWQKILSGKIEIVIGTRMAIFAPLENLGLIILDDEENNLYKSEQFPYYDARTIVWKLTKIQKTKLVFASIAPRVETYYFTFWQEKFYPLDLRKKTKPLINLIDMKDEVRNGNYLPVSDTLKESILETLGRSKKVLLFLKRRGFGTFNFCADCGYTFICPRCQIPLVSEKKNKSSFFVCHHCHYQMDVPNRCPRCQGVEIKMKGIAIQKIEEILSQLPEIKNYRLQTIEAETKEKKNDEAEIILTTIPFYRDYSEKSRPLSGSRLWSRWGENVGLVAVINADVLLYQPDFQSFEKTFQEIISIINWTSHFKIPTIIQTWSKDNYAIENAVHNNFENFYQQELEIRKEFSYPPFTRLFRLTIQEKNWEKLNKISLDFEKNLSRIQSRDKNIKIFPYSIPPRRKKVFEKSFLIKVKNLHPITPLSDEIKKILPLNSFLEPM